MAVKPEATEARDSLRLTAQHSIGQPEKAPAGVKNWRQERNGIFEEGKARVEQKPTAAVDPPKNLKSVGHFLPNFFPCFFPLTAA